MNVPLDPSNHKLLVTNNISDEDLEKEFQSMEKYQIQQKNNNNISNGIDPRDIHICRWLGCMIQFQELDGLVNHVNENHIPSKKDVTSEFVCRWSGCSRNGINQPSRFALISHLRTHTGEKPFYCMIPECLKSFTRADALLKHLKAVHQVDATNIQDAYEIIRKNVSKSLQKFEKQNEYKIDIGDNCKKIVSQIERRIYNESLMSHDDLIKSYTKMRHASKMKLQNKIADHYKIKKIEFSWPRAEKVTNQISNAIESYCNKKDKLESQNKIATVSGLDNIEELSVQELEKIVEIQKDYQNKLLKLRRLLDNELLKYSNLNRYYWMKKQALLNYMLVNEESNIV
ncbi:hypothetical protein CANINC_001668 [Pichia inconspicua]|uniref:C2H2-type domain-containing protein n=1 Tax=Pichia inconspicua TaxID=52247 RepID=A0A4V4NFW9_9ASCO|nr:hypothetical protein CANINC_001668 [[Candida] inconspicua]